MVLAYFVFVVVFFFFTAFELQITSFENLTESMDPFFRGKKCICTRRVIRFVMDTHGIDCQRALDASWAL